MLNLSVTSAAEVSQIWGRHCSLNLSSMCYTFNDILSLVQPHIHMTPLTHPLYDTWLFPLRERSWMYYLKRRKRCTNIANFPSGICSEIVRATLASLSTNVCQDPGYTMTALNSRTTHTSLHSTVVVNRDYIVLIHMVGWGRDARLKLKPAHIATFVFFHCPVLSNDWNTKYTIHNSTIHHT